MSFQEQKEKKKDCPEVVCEKSDPLGTYRKYAQNQKNMKFKDEEEDGNTSASSGED